NASGNAFTAAQLITISTKATVRTVRRNCPTPPLIELTRNTSSAPPAMTSGPRDPDMSTFTSVRLNTPTMTNRVLSDLAYTTNGKHMRSITVKNVVCPLIYENVLLIRGLLVAPKTVAASSWPTYRLKTLSAGLPNCAIPTIKGTRAANKNMAKNRRSEAASGKSEGTTYINGIYIRYALTPYNATTKFSVLGFKTWIPHTTARSARTALAGW